LPEAEILFDAPSTTQLFLHRRAPLTTNSNGTAPKGKRKGGWSRYYSHVYGVYITVYVGLMLIDIILNYFYL
jgi:hypothetical protein